MYNKVLITVNQDVIDRFVQEQNDFAPRNEWPLLRVIDFRITADQSFVKLQRAVDKNKILLDWRNSQNVVSIQVELFLQKYKILDMYEEINLRNDIYNSKKLYLFIRYFAEAGECFPMEIRPEGLPIHEYDIVFDATSNTIRRIANKELRTDVRFLDMSQQEKTGYVTGSVLDIWTQAVPTDPALETLNIFHLHLNDTSDEVAFDVAYMHDGEDISHFCQFKTDATGRPLRYKIIAKDMKIHTVLYNMNVVEKEQSAVQQMQGHAGSKEGVIELPFREHRV